jgi:hypothetical protein
VHLAAIAQSFGLFVVVCLAMASLLSLAVAGLARMERAAVPVRRSDRLPADPGSRRVSAADRVSSPGSTTYGRRAD